MLNIFFIWIGIFKDQNLLAVEEWNPLIKTVDAEVKILVCDQCSIGEEQNPKFTKKIDGKWFSCYTSISVINI